MATAIGDDYAEHEKSYRSFVHGAQLAVAGLAMLLLLLAVFLL